MARVSGFCVPVTVDRGPEHSGPLGALLRAARALYMPAHRKERRLGPC